MRREIGQFLVDNMRERILRDALIVLSSKGVNVLLALISTALIARLLVIEDVGRFFIAFSLAQIGSLVVALGFETIGLRTISRLRATGQTGAVTDFVKSLLGAYNLAVLGFLALGCALAWAATTLAPGEAGPAAYLIILLWIVSISYRMVISGIFRGLDMIVHSNAVNVTLYNLATCLLLGLVWTLGPDIVALETVLTILVAASLLALAYALVMLARVAGATPLLVRIGELAALVGEGFLIVVTKTVPRAAMQASLWIVAGLGTLYEAALYGAGLRVFTALAMPNTVVEFVGAQQLAGLSALGDRRRLSLLARSSALAASLPVAAFAALMVVFGELFMTTLFGQEFAPAALPLTLLACGRAAQLAIGQGRTLLLMAGHTRTLSTIQLVMGPLLVAVALAGYLAGGVTGLAAGVAVTLTLDGLVVCIAVARRTGVVAVAFLTPRELRQMIGPRLMGRLRKMSRSSDAGTR